MPTKLFRFIVPITALFALTSCFSFKDIELKDFSIDKVTPYGTKIIIDFSAEVDNPNRGFVIQSVAGDLNRNQKPFGAIQLMQAINVPGKTEERCSGQLQFNVSDIMSLFQMGGDINSLDLSSILFTGDVQVRAAWLKKKFKYNNISLDQIAKGLK
ncbi:MAG: LEA type 2 family protein [Prevotellaceae bacterium]|jgi:hypothetical protein|nr:LEA type 2 family protein [Prevotellaceae bacterium]